MNAIPIELPPRALSPNHNPVSPPRGDFHRASKRIQELIERVQALSDAETRELMVECLQSLLSLYGEGFERILKLIDNAGEEGEAVKQAFLGDKLVRGLLLIHGLHPMSLEDRVLGALNKIRPYLQSHGGNVELLGLQNDVARLRLQGTCQSCPSSSVTLELAVRQAIEEACPDLAGFEVEGTAPETQQPAPGPCLTAP